MGTFSTMSGSEMEIMRVIWSRGAPVTAGDLLDAFAHRGWKAQTMSTFLSRLVEKGILHSRRQGRGNLYVPAVSEAEYRRLAARQVVEQLYDGSLSAFLSALSGGQGLERGEVEELRAWFEEVCGHD